MNKADIVQALANNGLSQAQAKTAIETLLAAWTDALKSGDSIVLAGFGTFKPAKRAARTGINPKTKEKIQIPAKTSVAFKAAQGLKEAVNS